MDVIRFIGSELNDLKAHGQTDLIFSLSKSIVEYGETLAEYGNYEASNEIFEKIDDLMYALIKSDTYDPNNTNNIANNTTNVIGAVDLSISKSVSNVTSHIGDIVEWTVEVTNRGPSDAINVIVYEAIPNGLQYISAVSSKGSFDNVTNIWTIGGLANGESVTLTLKTLVAVSNVNLTNVVSVKSSNYDVNESDNIANNTTEVGPEADLGVIKLICNSTSPPNGKAIWSVIVTNYGPDSAKNVVATDKIPDLLKYISHKSQKGTYNHDTGKWIVGDLKVNETVKLVIETKILSKGLITNPVNVTTSTFDTNKSNNFANATVNITEKKKHIPHENRTVNHENKTCLVHHKEIKTYKNATGNPILLLISALALLGTKTLRRRK